MHTFDLALPLALPHTSHSFLSFPSLTHTRYTVQPIHPELLLSESRARQVVQQYAVQYSLSGQICRQININPRLLGRITGNIWVNDSAGERVDIGLAVKNAKQGLCVPGESVRVCVCD